MKEVGYHGTCSKYKYSIEAEGFDPAKSKYRSDHWLGQGVYFFDDYEKALWWAGTISAHNGDCGKVIFQSVIEAPEDEVLNLDDNHQLDCFLSELISDWEEIKKSCDGTMPIFENRKFRAVYFDYYKQKNGISVIISTFQKDIAGYTIKRNPLEKEKQKKLMDIIGIRFKERQICVSKKECITLTKMVYDEEDEVV